MQPQDSFDVIVVGLGSMGAPACYYLAKNGLRVLGLEQFTITHEWGSHAGQSRIIRKAYFEDPRYVPLLDRAYANWRELEALTGEQIYYQTGLLYLGNPANPLIRGVLDSSRRFNIPLHEYKGVDQQATFEVPGDFTGVYEQAAGFVRPEKSISLYAGLSKELGAELRESEKVLEWTKTNRGIEVTTEKGTYRSTYLVLTAGAWTPGLEVSTGKRIKVTRQVVGWARLKDEEQFGLGRFPCWMLAEDGRPGCFYGFPVLPAGKFGHPEGLKLAYHFPGPPADPDRVDRKVNEADRELLEGFLEKYLPGYFGSWVDLKVCLYANSPDEHFIIDKIDDRVAIACGFSGHGFKFAPVVGEILADLVLTGSTDFEIGFLRANRFDAVNK